MFAAQEAQPVWKYLCKIVLHRVLALNAKPATVALAPRQIPQLPWVSWWPAVATLHVSAAPLHCSFGLETGAGENKMVSRVTWFVCSSHPGTVAWGGGVAGGWENPLPILFLLDILIRRLWLPFSSLLLPHVFLLLPQWSRWVEPNDGMAFMMTILGNEMLKVTIFFYSLTWATG